MSDVELQDEELEALEAIYGDDCICSREERSVKIWLPNRTHSAPLVVEAHLPVDYPSTSAPVIQLRRDGLDGELLSDAVSQLESMFAPGEVVVFMMVEWLKTQDWLVPEEAVDGEGGDVGPVTERMGECTVDDASGAESEGTCQEAEDEGLTVKMPWGVVRVVSEEDKRQLELMESVYGRIVHAEPFTERKSTFQAHCCNVTNVDQVKAVVDCLLLNNKVRNATHNIMAYRIEVPDKKGVFLQDFDDDGEDAAGGRLLHLLQVADARDVVVVVSRWFGGVLLGPSRFTHINNAARMLLEAEGYINAGGSGKQKKKGK